MRLFFQLCSLFILGISLSSSLHAKDVVKVYTYHDKPPYFIHLKNDTESNHSGIYYDFINYLNTQQSKVIFKLKFMPRIRLENELKQNQLDGIVIGVNPLWFSDKNREKYLWSHPIMIDQDIFIVNKNSRILSPEVEELIGLKIALTRGSYYKGISELIKKRAIDLAATNTAQQNLEMLAYKRADITIMSQLTAKYFFNNLYPKKQFRVLDQPHDTFERMLLIPNNQSHLYKELNQITMTALSDKRWTKQLNKWKTNEKINK